MSEGESKHGVQGLGQAGYGLSVGVRESGRGQCSGYNSPIITDICPCLPRPGILLCPCHKPVREVVPLYPFSVGRTAGEKPQMRYPVRRVGTGMTWYQLVTHGHHTPACPQTLGKQGCPGKREPAAGSPTYRRKIPYLTTRALLKHREHGHHAFARHERVRCGLAGRSLLVAFLGAGLELHSLTSSAE